MCASMPAANADMHLLPVCPAALLAPEPVALFSFDTAKTVDKWHVFTDSYFGGKSEASFTYNLQEQV